jgi:hypothetical protein
MIDLCGDTGRSQNASTGGKRVVAFELGVAKAEGRVRGKLGGFERTADAFAVGLGA